MGCSRSSRSISPTRPLLPPGTTSRFIGTGLVKRLGGGRLPRAPVFAEQLGHVRRQKCLCIYIRALFVTLLSVSCSMVL